ncbi:MFS polyamine transporter [Flagelloscypha sp. PMI_526]|nr:MFS polyamine transporter [Flagelloscypha sp. PMI_526]
MTEMSSTNEGLVFMNKEEENRLDCLGGGARIDPRISTPPASPPESTATSCDSGTLGDVLYVEFEPSDPRNPANFSTKKKYAMAITACSMTAAAALAASAFPVGIPSMMRDLGCSKMMSLVALTSYNLGFAITPLITASFSEEFGRNPLYLGSQLGFMLMFLMIAKSRNIETVIVARFLQGAFGSTGSTMVGGTLADIFPPHERGIPMTIFSVACFVGTSIGPAVGGYLEMDQRFGWKWIQWVQMMIAAVQLVIIPVVMTETRVGVLLTRKAKKLRKETGDIRYRARIEDERTSLKTLIFISCTRPIYLLFREPVVASFSLWIGFLWGIFFVFIESVTTTFTQLHGFDTGQAGLVFLTMTIGALFGVCSNFIQEFLYKKNVVKRGPEARLYLACFAGVLFPASMFIYAWCSFPWVHWIAQAIALVMFIWAAFIMYLAVFSYLADCYGIFASSALAGQSLCRNLAAVAFPLFTDQMFSALNIKWACTMFACLAVLMAPIPFGLFLYGPTLRRRSKFSSQVMDKHAAKLDEKEEDPTP